MTLRDEALDVLGGVPSAGEVLLFFDYTCPFCYVERSRYERLERETGTPVLPIPLELRPSLPAEGVPAAAYGLSHGDRVDAHLARVAREAGLPFVLPDVVPNTHRAIVLTETARDVGRDAHARRARLRRAHRRHPPVRILAARAGTLRGLFADLATGRRAPLVSGMMVRGRHRPGTPSDRRT